MKHLGVFANCAQQLLSSLVRFMTCFSSGVFANCAQQLLSSLVCFMTCFSSGVFANCAQQLQQGGSADAAVPMKTASLPPVSSVIYGDKLSATVRSLNPHTLVA